MATPFDFINSINSHDKKDIIREADSREQAEKDYVPFIVNRGLSYFADTVLYANEMNLIPGVEKIAQFDYLRLSIRPKKRWSKWHKAEENADLDLVRSTYGYSAQKARAVLPLLSQHQLDELRKNQFQNTGGVSK